MEQWRRINRYLGYEVSSCGRVRRVDSGKLRKPVKLKNGYLTVMFFQNSRYRVEYIHRLVAEAFLHRVEGQTQVNHKDHDRENNAVENLEWCDALYNVQYSRARQVEQLSLEGAPLAIFKGVREAERALCVGHGRIALCAAGKAKTAHGYKWRYVE